MPKKRSGGGLSPTQQAAKFLGVSVLEAGYVTSDEAVPQAVRRRTPFILGQPKCPASQCIAQLAMRLEQGVAAAAGNDNGAGGFFSRMSKWFKR